MRVNVEVRKNRGTYREFVLSWCLAMAGCLLLVLGLLVQIRSRDLRAAQARLDQAMVTIDNYHRLVKQGAR